MKKTLAEFTVGFIATDTTEPIKQLQLKSIIELYQMVSMFESIYGLELDIKVSPMKMTPASRFFSEGISDLINKTKDE